MKNIGIFVIGLISFQLSAQTETHEELLLSLEEAISLGLENNYSSINSEMDVEKAIKQKWEIIAQGLPQISGNVDYQNYLQQPVTLIPAEIGGGPPGTFMPVRFGTKQNLSGTATWNQLIFDGSYFVGVQSARTLLQISKNAKVKTDLEVRKAIINAYGNVLLAHENVQILKKNLKTAKKNLQETKVIYQNGLAEEEDVEQLKITLLGLETNLERSTRMLNISYQVLNMALGIPVEVPVELSEDLETLALRFYEPALLKETIPVEENIDVRIAANTAEAAKIYLRLEKAKALPKLSGFLNFGATGHSDKFTFFNQEQAYYSQSILGLNLSIPIFSSGMRSARTKQKELEYQQALVDLKKTRSQVQMEIASAKSDYQFSLKNLEVQQERLELAERIENKNQIKFFEGLATSFELSEAQQQLYTAQQGLLQAMLEVIKSRVALENALSTATYQETEN